MTAYEVPDLEEAEREWSIREGLIRLEGEKGAALEGLAEGLTRSVNWTTEEASEKFLDAWAEEQARREERVEKYKDPFLVLVLDANGKVVLNQLATECVMERGPTETTWMNLEDWLDNPFGTTFQSPYIRFRIKALKK